ncbi:MAG: phage N-6-adenine-methyltransferase [Gammaproteobacteria bacterium]|nr:phage N-6-adenine-methyltransferase [Gammaproteobacteria bacterium]MDH5731305.1 phage N-6-adenine-methyltransferase [Gammaproteobacteria bacterium]
MTTHKTTSQTWRERITVHYLDSCLHLENDYDYLRQLVQQARRTEVTHVNKTALLMDAVELIKNGELLIIADPSPVRSISDCLVHHQQVLTQSPMNEHNQASISELSWDQALVTQDEIVRITFRANNISQKTRASVAVFFENAHGERNWVDSLNITLTPEQQHYSIEWQALNEHFDHGWFKTQLNIPHYYFEVAVGKVRLSSKSAKLSLKKNLAFRVTHANATPVADGTQFILKAAHRQLFKTRSKQGHILFKDVVIGPYSVECLDETDESDLNYVLSRGSNHANLS